MVRNFLTLVVLAFACVVPSRLMAAAQTAADREAFARSVCTIIDTEALRNGLPQDFFTRLIWKESLFDAGAVSPVGAQGIAQFMPGTATLRGLADPFDVPSALAASAAYLADLRATFGNLGNAAAAYNAGEDAARRWLAGQSQLPFETQDYVATITGHSHEEWKVTKVEFAMPGLGGSGDFSTRCQQLVLRQTEPQTVKVARAAWKPWSVVVAGGFSEARALQAFRAASLAHASLIGGEKPMVTRERNLSRGTRRLVKVAIGRDSRTAAEALCQQLQDHGGACMVTRTNR